MSLIEQIQKDITTAMKAREEQRLSTLRMVKTALKNREIDKMAPLDDKEAQQVLSTLIKQRKESVEQFTKGGRQEMADKEAAEIKLIEAYMPKAAGEDEIVAGVKAVIAEMGSPTMKDMGTVMKNVMARFAGAGVRVDGKQVSEAVKRELTPKYEWRTGVSPVRSLAPLQLPVGFALRHPHLLGDFLQRRLLVQLLLRHDLLQPFADAHSRRRCFLLCSFHFANQQRDLALDVAARLQRFQNFTSVPAQELFVDLGHFAGDDHVPLASQNLNDVFQRFLYPMRRLVKHLRPWRFADALEKLASLTNLRGQKSAEAKRIRRQATGNQSRQKRRRARNRHDRDVMPNGQRDQPEPGIRNAGHARVRH